MVRRFIFWQNINSIHQSEFLLALSATHEVVLVTTEPDTGRALMGWTEPELPGVRHVRMEGGDWRSLIRADSRGCDCHVFAGLHAFPRVHAAFRLAVTRGCRIGIYSEPLVRSGWLGWLKDLRGRLDSIRYGSAIDFVLCIGPDANRQFRHWGFEARRLHTWGYVTRGADVQGARPTREGPFRAVFPASLIPRKGADILVRAVALMRHRDAIRIDAFSLDPARVDRWQSDLIQEAAATQVVSVMPYIDNGELLRRLPGYDLLVMPSRHDGWGAAVNEALTAGIPALVSGRCGSASLIEGRPLLGEVTEPDEQLLAARLDDLVERGRPDAARRRAIRHWALQHISGKALAGHFLAIVGADAGRQTCPVPAPWERDTATEAAVPAVATT